MFLLALLILREVAMNCRTLQNQVQYIFFFCSLILWQMWLDLNIQQANLVRVMWLGRSRGHSCSLKHFYCPVMRELAHQYTSLQYYQLCMILNGKWRFLIVNRSDFPHPIRHWYSNHSIYTLPVRLSVCLVYQHNDFLPNRLESIAYRKRGKIFVHQQLNGAIN